VVVEADFLDAHTIELSFSGIVHAADFTPAWLATSPSGATAISVTQIDPETLDFGFSADVTLDILYALTNQPSYVVPGQTGPILH
jgi:hypothetical protein